MACPEAGKQKREEKKKNVLASHTTGVHVHVVCPKLTHFYSRSRVVVVLTLTRTIKSVVTGQAPVTLELRNTPVYPS